jgi:colanic acid biosynthesis glycosyl transferase WcaI
MTSRSVVFMNRYYGPEQPATGQLLTDLAEDLAGRGWEVTVLTGGGPPDGSPRLPRRETRNGVRILHLRGRLLGRPYRVRRVLGFLAYLASATLALLRIRRPDAIVAMTDPPLLILPALLAARLRRARTVYWVQGIFPHQAARLGLLRPGSLAERTLHHLARHVHRRCDAMVAPGEGMSEVLLAAGAPRGRLACIHNWADTKGIRPLNPAVSVFRAEHGLQDKFVVLYSGSAARAHTFGAVLDAAWLLRDRQDIVFLFIGGGQELPHLEANVWRYGLENVRFMDHLPADRLADSLSAANVSLVTENPEFTGLRIPSKTYRILASGRPLLFVGSDDSEVARIITSLGCGIVVPYDDGEALAAAVLRLQNSPEETGAMGRQARLAAVSLFNRRTSGDRWHDLLERLMVEGPALEAVPLSRRQETASAPAHRRRALSAARTR